MKKAYPKYKEVDLPWLKELPEGWDIEKGKWLFQKENRPVRDEDEVVTAFRDGEVTLRKNRREDGFTFSLKEIGYQGIRKGDLVIHGMDAFAGAIGVSDSDGKSSPVYNACTLKLPGEPWYFCHAVREMSRSGYIQSLAKGIRERSTDFRFDTFGEQLLPLPSLPEQRQIAAFLDHKCALIDTFIEKKSRLIELLKEQKQAIINQAVTKGIDPNVKMKPSGIDWLGDIPEHWEIVRIKHLLKGIIDTEHKTVNFEENGRYLVVRTSNVKSGKLITENAKYTNEEGFRGWTRRGIPQPGDILFTREAPAGEACVVPKNIPLCMGQRMVWMKMNQDLLSSKFTVYSIYSELAQYFVFTLSGGSTVAHFNMSDIGNIPIMNLPIEEQKEIVSWLDEELGQIEDILSSTNRELELIKEYKTTLIAEAVTGKIDVRDWKPKEVDQEIEVTQNQRSYASNQ